MKKIILLILSACPFFLNAQQISQFTLPNGLQVMVKPDHRAPVAILQVWYKVGGSYETDGTTGISHVLEHMMFLGTEKNPGDSFNQIMAQHGAIYNAMTTNDFTMYYEEIPVRYLPLALQLEADRMTHLKLNEKDFSKEMAVVKSEKRLRYDNNPQALLLAKFMTIAHVSNPYHHPTIGWQSDLDHMQLNEIKYWYKAWYQPNNAIIVIAGDVTPNYVYQLIQQNFAKIARENVPQLKPRSEQTLLGKRHVIISAPANVPFLIMGFNTPNYKNAVDKNDIYALVILNAILGQNNSSRFQNNLVMRQQVASMIQSNYDPFTLHDDAFEIFAVPTKNVKLNKLKLAILQQIQDLKNNLITEKELNRAKAQLISNKVFETDSLNTQAMNVGNLAVIGLPYQLDQDLLNKLQTVTAVQLQQVAKKYFRLANMVVAELQPNKIQMTENQTVDSSIN